MSGARFVEFGIVLVLAVVTGWAVIVYVGWNRTHDKLRKEKKEDERDSKV